MSVLLPSSTLPAVARRNKSLDNSEARKASISNCSSTAITLKIPFAFLHFHRAFAVMIDHPVFTLRIPHRDQLSDNLRNRIGIGSDRSGAGRAAERAHTAADGFHRTCRNEIEFRQCERISTNQHAAFLGIVKRNDGNIFEMDVLPDVHLRPVRKRKNADDFAGVQFARKKIPKFGALIFRIPLTEGITERKNALLGAGFFLVPASTSKCRVESTGSKGIE